MGDIPVNGEVLDAVVLKPEVVYGCVARYDIYPKGVKLPFRVIDGCVGTVGLCCDDKLVVLVELEPYVAVESTAEEIIRDAFP